MRSILLASAAVLALSQVALAQSSNNAQPTGNDQTVTKQHLGSNLQNMLQKSGYTDIRVAPTSFVVHAKDTDGNPVVMSVSPDSFTEVTDLNAANGTATNSSAMNGSTTESATASRNATGANRFVAISANDDLSSKVVGLDVYNDNKQDIGQIKDIALNENGRTQAYILSVGGFLGLGEHYVAVNPSSVKVSYNDSDKKWHASMNTTSDQLKTAPEFKYAGRWASRI